MRRRSPAPLWFQVVVAVVIALALRALDAWLATPASGGGDAPPVVLAFWQIVAAVAGWIWTGVQAAGQVTLHALEWAVAVLWTFAKTVYNLAIGVGKEVYKGLRKTWEFFETTYEHVLKPAWQHFWRFFERARKWLEDILRPVFKWLNYVRKHIIEFYTRYVRPILDTIDAARRVLRVLSTLGLDWARQLDATLAEIQRRIEEPFRYVLAKINGIINVVNRIVTADGLFQRVALIRTVERDIAIVSRVWWNTSYTPLTDAQRNTISDVKDYPTPAQHASELKHILAGDAGHRSTVVEEHAADLRLMLRRLREAR